MTTQDPGSSLRGLMAMLRWQIKKAATFTIRLHLERALAEVVEAERKERDEAQR